MKIGIINNKGGVLKTTVSTNIACSLSLKNKKIIMIDLDGQGNVIATFGKKPDTLEFTIMDFLKSNNNKMKGVSDKKKCTLNDVVIKIRENLHIIPGNDELNYFDFLLNTGEITQSDLKILINSLDKIYDYVIIDTPPAMSVIVATTLSIIDLALIPFEPDQYSILGLKRIINAAKEFKKRKNENLKIIAIPTKVNARVTIHKEIIDKVIKPKLKMQQIYVTDNFVSMTTKSTASVGYERVPIVFSSIKTKYQDEYHKIRDEILNYCNREEK